MRRSERQLMERAIRKGGGAAAENGTRRNRDLNDLICEAITLCSGEGRRKTNIMYGVYLSYSLTAPLVDWLERTGLIEGRPDKNGNKVYYTTEKGLRFLDLEQQQRHVLGLPEDEPTAKTIRRQWEQNGFKFNQKKADASEIAVVIS